MVFLEYKHRPQSNGTDTACPDVNTELFHRFDKRRRVLRVEGYEGSKNCTVRILLSFPIWHSFSFPPLPSVLAAQVPYVCRIFRCQLLHLCVEDSADPCLEGEGVTILRSIIFLNKKKRHTHCVTRSLSRISFTIAFAIRTRAGSPIHLCTMLTISTVGSEEKTQCIRIEQAKGLVRD